MVTFFKTMCEQIGFCVLTILTLKSFNNNVRHEEKMLYFDGNGHEFMHSLPTLCINA